MNGLPKICGLSKSEINFSSVVQGAAFNDSSLYTFLCIFMLWIIADKENSEIEAESLQPAQPISHIVQFGLLQSFIQIFLYFNPPAVY